jgi:F-type H+-transporting ATPase subunit epsilon
MAKLMSIDIVTPEKKIFEGKMRGITAPGIDGEFGVLPEHAPFATVLAPGVVEFTREDGTRDIMAVSGGYVEVTREKVILLVETAERPDEVDVETIKRRKEEQERLLKAKDKKDVDYDAIQIALIKEMRHLRALELLNKRRKQ